MQNFVDFDCVAEAAEAISLIRSVNSIISLFEKLKFVEGLGNIRLSCPLGVKPFYWDLPIDQIAPKLTDSGPKQLLSKLSLQREPFWHI